MPNANNPGGAASLEAAHKKLDDLIADKQVTIGDGSIQVVMAVASITNLVTVDTSQDPPAVSPANLGDLTFDDPAVGISDDQMPIFRANLKTLLPLIGDDIDQIPDNSKLPIAKVARFVQLSIMAKS
jgi:hypothetical protein